MRPLYLSRTNQLGMATHLRNELLGTLLVLLGGCCLRRRRVHRRVRREDHAPKLRQARRLVLKLSKSGSGVWSPFLLSLDQNLEVLTPKSEM